MSKPGFPCIGLEIGSGHILCVISFLGIDMMANQSIGIWNWIGVYLRSCLPLMILNYFGLEIGLGLILCVISFLDIDMIASLSNGIWNWIRVCLRPCLSSKMSKLGFHVLDWKLD